MKAELRSVSLLLDDCRGTYIPRDFVTGFKIIGIDGETEGWANIEPGDVEVCKDPDHEWYWEAWQDILDNATYTEDGHTWQLMQDGAVWAYCLELMDDEEKESFGFDLDK